MKARGGSNTGGASGLAQGGAAIGQAASPLAQSPARLEGDIPNAALAKPASKRPIDVLGVPASNAASQQEGQGSSQGLGLDHAGSQIDAFMERASAALLRMDYFATIDNCLRAMERARRKRDYERLARITMPLQEARRQVRQLACDARLVRVLRSLPTRGQVMEAGLYLLEPPLIGLDANVLREYLRVRSVPALVLAKEPTTSTGKWPIVGVGRGEFENVVARVQIDPPESLRGVSTPLDAVDAALLHAALADGAWFQSAQEALGDAAIRKVRAEWPAGHRVDDLIEYLDGVPDHEKLSQALERAARAAMIEPEPTTPRRRPWIDNPYGL